MTPVGPLADHAAVRAVHPFTGVFVAWFRSVPGRREKGEKGEKGEKKTCMDEFTTGKAGGNGRVRSKRCTALYSDLNTKQIPFKHGSTMLTNTN